MQADGCLEVVDAGNLDTPGGYKVKNYPLCAEAERYVVGRRRLWLATMCTLLLHTCDGPKNRAAAPKPNRYKSVTGKSSPVHTTEEPVVPMQVSESRRCFTEEPVVQVSGFADEPG